MDQWHILNGDALLKQFGNTIEGKKIICHECLIEGIIQGKSLSEFFDNRATYLQKTYDVPKLAYSEKTELEFQKIKTIPENTVINLWFEDDLFCQTNFWFVANLLIEWKINCPIFLVRPNKGNEYSFGMMSTEQLHESFGNKIKISKDELGELQNLWNHYVEYKHVGMMMIARALQKPFPFLVPAVQAYFDKCTGKPEHTLKQIITELQTKDFGPVFREFCKREAIYGFGDLQVKTMFDNLNTQNN